MKILDFSGDNTGTLNFVVKLKDVEDGKVNNILNSAINNDEELCCDTLIVMLYAQLEGYVNDLLL